MSESLNKIIKLVAEKRAEAEHGDSEYHRLMTQQSNQLIEEGKLVAEDYAEEEDLEAIAAHFEIDLEELRDLSIEDFLILQDAYERRDD